MMSKRHSTPQARRDTPGTAGHRHGQDPDDRAHPFEDPVCGMVVDPHLTPHRTEHSGCAFYFCSAGCRQKFETDPSRYFSPEGAKQTDQPMPEGTVYTCPMHPEVRQAGPG